MRRILTNRVVISPNFWRHPVSFGIKQPIPFLNSPMGPMGLLQGTLIFIGTRTMGVLDDLHAKFGISPIVSGVIISMAGVLCGMMSIILLTIVSTPKEKND